MANSVRVHPFGDYPLRTEVSVSEHAYEAESTGSPVHTRSLVSRLLKM
jgi:hypothetical protein